MCFLNHLGAACAASKDGCQEVQVPVPSFPASSFRNVHLLFHSMEIHLSATPAFEQQCASENVCQMPVGASRSLTNPNSMNISARLMSPVSPVGVGRLRDCLDNYKLLSCQEVLVTAKHR